ncbi:MAG: hypothetical protein Q7S04_02750 [Candidatus Moranbacteria bacterium]|nr:hypothetical protein [Candidatus Moranbacteria bacterium]
MRANLAASSASLTFLFSAFSLSRMQTVQVPAPLHRQSRIHPFGCTGFGFGETPARLAYLFTL